MTRQDAQRIGRRYLSHLEDIDKRAHRVIDKMPHNFENLWLLALLFPNASFVHVTRSAEDTCLSIYMTPLPPHHSYNESQASLGRYFNLYRDLMAHWSEVLPVALRHQSYESLVSDNETESRALLAHTGLDWDDDCLKPLTRPPRSSPSAESRHADRSMARPSGAGRPMKGLFSRF